MESKTESESPPGGSGLRGFSADDESPRGSNGAYSSSDHSPHVNFLTPPGEMTNDYWPSERRISNHLFSGDVLPQHPVASPTSSIHSQDSVMLSDRELSLSTSHESPYLSNLRTNVDSDGPMLRTLSDGTSVFLKRPGISTPSMRTIATAVQQRKSSGSDIDFFHRDSPNRSTTSFFPHRSPTPKTLDLQKGFSSAGECTRPIEPDHLSEAVKSPDSSTGMALAALDLEARNLELEMQVNELSHELTVLRRQSACASPIRSNPIAGLLREKQEFQSADEELEMLREALRQRDEEIAALKGRSAQRGSKFESVFELKEKNTRLRKQVSELRSRSQYLQMNDRIIEESQATIRDLTRKLQTTRRKLDVIRSADRIQQLDNDTIHGRFRLMQQKIDEFEVERRCQSTQISLLKQKVSVLEKDCCHAKVMKSVYKRAGGHTELATPTSSSLQPLLTRLKNEIKSSNSSLFKVLSKLEEGIHDMEQSLFDVKARENRLVGLLEKKYDY